MPHHALTLIPAQVVFCHAWAHSPVFTNAGLATERGADGARLPQAASLPHPVAKMHHLASGDVMLSAGFRGCAAGVRHLSYRKAIERKARISAHGGDAPGFNRSHAVRRLTLEVASIALGVILGLAGEQPSSSIPVTVSGPSIDSSSIQRPSCRHRCEAKSVRGPPAGRARSPGGGGQNPSWRG